MEVSYSRHRASLLFAAAHLGCWRKPAFCQNDTYDSIGMLSDIKPEGQYHAIRFTINGKSMTAAWIDTPTTKDFVPLLEMTLELDDYASTEKIAYLPPKLSPKGARAGVHPGVGDIAKSATMALIHGLD